MTSEDVNPEADKLQGFVKEIMSSYFVEDNKDIFRDDLVNIVVLNESSSFCGSCFTYALDCQSC